MWMIPSIFKLVLRSAVNAFRRSLLSMRGTAGSAVGVMLMSGTCGDRRALSELSMHDCSRCLAAIMHYQIRF